MAKKIRRGFPLFIAPDIMGFYLNHIPWAYDLRNNVEIDPQNTNDKITIYERVTI